MAKQTIGDRIKLIRTDYKLTQAAMAEALDVSLLTVSNLERNVYEKPSTDTIKSLVDKFGTTTDWLEKEKGLKYPNGQLEFKKSGSQDLPWKDEAYQEVKGERDRLIQQVKFFQDLIVSAGLNFLASVKETA
jgi:transcriptional regulator with XRE-family HTH domain